MLLNRLFVFFLHDENVSREFNGKCVINVYMAEKSNMELFCFELQLHGIKIFNHCSTLKVILETFPSSYFPTLSIKVVK